MTGLFDDEPTAAERGPQIEEIVEGQPFFPSRSHIELSSGSYLDLAAPNPDAIRLADVAHGLALTCRFGGQCSRFYSVAEHAVLVSTRLERWGAPIDVQLAGLHHDDAEAFIGDFASPIKAIIPDLSVLEDTVFASVCAALKTTDLPFYDPRIKEADYWALSAEAYYLLPSRGVTWGVGGLYDPTDESAPRLTSMGLEPYQAAMMWLGRHTHLADPDRRR